MRKQDTEEILQRQWKKTRRFRQNWMKDILGARIQGGIDSHNAGIWAGVVKQVRVQIYQYKKTQFHGDGGGAYMWELL